MAASQDQSTGFLVRRAAMSDLNTLVEFNAAMAQETESRTLELDRLRDGVAAVLNDETLGFYCVAEELGTVIGQLLITTEWSDWRNGYFWWIQSVYVAPGFRRRGVYSSLHSYVTAEARREGNVCGLRLYVDRDNVAAHKTYTSLDMRRSNYQLWETNFEPAQGRPRRQ